MGGVKPKQIAPDSACLVEWHCSWWVRGLAISAAMLAGFERQLAPEALASNVDDGVFR
jgi:hypothetical protein